MLLELESARIQLQPGRTYLVGKKGQQFSEFCLEIAGQNDVDEKHAVIDVHSSAATISITDLCSSAGTFINGQRLMALDKVSVSSDANVRFGDVRGKIEMDLTEESANSSGFHDVPNSISNTKLCLEAKPKHLCTGEHDVSKRSEHSFDASEANKTVDSFTIPETQFCEQNVSLVAEQHVYIAESDTGNETSDDSYIPETQQVLTAGGQECGGDTLPICTASNSTNQMLQLNSPFRINTQDFNENYSGNESDDLFTSLTIPHITHSPVNTTKNLKNSTANDSVNAEKDSAEMSALMWTGSISTNNSITNEREVNTCTTSLFDMPALADVDVQKTDQYSTLEKSAEETVATDVASVYSELKPTPVTIDLNKSGSGNFLMPPDQPGKVERVVSKSSTTTIEDLLFGDDDEDDLMSTQVFSAAINEQKSNGKCGKEKALENETEYSGGVVHLTLSDKENALPMVIESNAGDEKTQVFGTHSVVNSAAVKKFSITKKNTTIEAEDTESLLATQVFPCSNQPNYFSASTNSITKPSLNSTLQSNDESNVVCTAKSFFEAIEKSSENADGLKTPDHRTSTVTSKADGTMQDSHTTIPKEFMMNTPQFIKEKFKDYTGSSPTVSLLPSRRKELFGEDSTEEEHNLLLIAPKITHDFDALLPHLKGEIPKHALQADKRKTKPQHKASDTSKKNKSEKDSISRSERYAARDREQLRSENENEKTKQSITSKGDELRNTNQESKRPKRRIAVEGEEVKTKLAKTEAHKEPHQFVNEVKNINLTNTQSTSEDKERPTRKMRSKDSARSSTKDMEPKVRKKVKEHTEYKTEPKTGSSISQSTASHIITDANDTSDAITNTREPRITRSGAAFKEIEKPMPMKRRTRLQSRLEEIATPPVNVQLQKAIEAKEQDVPIKKTEKRRQQNVYKMSTEGHLTTNSSSNNSPRSSSTTASKQDACSSTQQSAATKEKRKSESCQESIFNIATTSSSATKTTRELKVSMTMVDPEIVQRLQQQSSNLWRLENDPTKCDVLIMDKGNRTFKFLIAVARGIPIVTSKWLEHLNKMQKITDDCDNFFKDVAFEKRHKFNLLKSLVLARKQKLFNGYEFLMTPNIEPTVSNMKDVINCAGGVVLVKPPDPKPQQHIYLITSKQDKQHWHKYRRANANIQIISTEGVMSAVMRHDLLPLNNTIFA